MEEYKLGHATVRIHGTKEPKKLKGATLVFLKKYKRKQMKK